jgi:hypothetical protein
MVSTTRRSTIWRASSEQLHRDSGTPVVAGSSQASALTSARTRGGKTLRSTRPCAIGKTVGAFLEETLAPLDHRVQGDCEVLGDGGVLLTVGRPQHDAGSQHHSLFGRPLSDQLLEPVAVLDAQLDHERTST